MNEEGPKQTLSPYEKALLQASLDQIVCATESELKSIREKLLIALIKFPHDEAIITKSLAAEKRAQELGIHL